MPRTLLPCAFASVPFRVLMTIYSPRRRQTDTSDGPGAGPPGVPSVKRFQQIGGKGGFEPPGFSKRQFRDALSQLCPVVADRLLHESLDSREGLWRHEHLPHAGHVRAVVVADQGE